MYLYLKTQNHDDKDEEQTDCDNRHAHEVSKHVSSPPGIRRFHSTRHW